MTDIVQTISYRNIILLLQAVIIVMSACTKEKEPVPEEPGKIVVLMYHRIVSDEPQDLYERSVAELEKDLQYLEENHVNIITFNDLDEINRAGEMPPGNSVIITFDDGSSSWYTLVKPLLLKYKMKATFFLWANNIGKDSFLTWDEVKDMAHYRLLNGERPFIFGSHSYSHVFLKDSRENYSSDEEYNAFLDYELGKSRELLEEYVPGEVDIFSLPYGNGPGDPVIIAAAQRNGYKFIRTSIWAAIESTPIDLFKIPSLPILDTTPQSLIGEYLGIGN